MGQIADRIATMQGCSLRQIVDEIARMEEGKKLVTFLPATVPMAFDRFWDAYPNKVGKGAARKAFEKASKAVSFNELMDGLALYAAKQDDRPWCNPATWLNQERWTDAPAQIKPKGLAGVRAELQQEIAHGERGTGPTGDYHSNAGRLAIGSRLDDERNGRRLL